MKAIQNLLIIGCGSIGERHLRCFQKAGRAKILACDNNQECLKRIQSQYQVDICENWDEALKSPEISAAVICTPAHLHVPMAIRALEEGKHVLIEKPLSTSLNRVEELIKLRDGGNLIAAVAYVLHFVPAIQALKNFLDKGEFGKPLHIVAAGGQHFPSFRPAYKNTYFTSHETGGGVIQDGLTHIINAVEWLTGPSHSIFCDGNHQALEGITVEDTANMIARNGDTLVSYSYNLFQAPNEFMITVHAEKGSVKTEFSRQRWSILPLKEEKWTHFQAEFEDRDSLFITQANAFLDLIEGKKNEMASLEEAIQTQKTILSALESFKTGTKQLP